MAGVTADMIFTDALYAIQSEKFRHALYLVRTAKHFHNPPSRLSQLHAIEIQCHGELGHDTDARELLESVLKTPSLLVAGYELVIASVSWAIWKNDRELEYRIMKEWYCAMGKADKVERAEWTSGKVKECMTFYLKCLGKRGEAGRRESRRVMENDKLLTEEERDSVEVVENVEGTTERLAAKKRMSVIFEGAYEEEVGEGFKEREKRISAITESVDDEDGEAKEVEEIEGVISPITESVGSDEETQNESKVMAEGCSVAKEHENVCKEDNCPSSEDISGEEGTTEEREVEKRSEKRKGRVLASLEKLPLEEKLEAYPNAEADEGNVHTFDSFYTAKDGSTRNSTVEPAGKVADLAAVFNEAQTNADTKIETKTVSFATERATTLVLATPEQGGYFKQIARKLLGLTIQALRRPTVQQYLRKVAGALAVLSMVLAIMGASRRNKLYRLLAAIKRSFAQMMRAAFGLEHGRLIF